MKKVSFILLLCVLSICSFAGEIPTKAIQGKVYDKITHEALAGVKVSLENSTQSVYTDLEGHFILLVSNQDRPVLKFSTVSYNEEKITVTDSFSGINVQLSEL